MSVFWQRLKTELFLRCFGPDCVWRFSSLFCVWLRTRPVHFKVSFQSLGFYDTLILFVYNSNNNNNINWPSNQTSCWQRRWLTDHHACQTNQKHQCCCYLMNPMTPNRYLAVGFVAVAVQNERVCYQRCQQPRCCAASMQCERASIYLFIYIHHHHHHLSIVSSQMQRLLRQYNLWSNQHDKYVKFIRLVRPTIQQQLARCLIYARALLEYVIFIWGSKILPSVKFAEDKVLTFFILCEKC